MAQLRPKIKSFEKGGKVGPYVSEFEEEEGDSRVRALVCENWEKNGEWYSREHKSEKK